MKVVLIIFLIFLFSSCNLDENPHGIKKITIAIGGCSKGCEFSIYEADSVRNLRYLCVWNCDSGGIRKGNISNETWNIINKALRGIELKNFNSQNNIQDTSLYLNIKLMTFDNQYFINGNLDSLPTKLSNFVRLTLNEFKKVNLAKSINANDFNFEIEVPSENYYRLPY